MATYFPPGPHTITRWFGGEESDLRMSKFRRSGSLLNGALVHESRWVGPPRVLSGPKPLREGHLPTPPDSCTNAALKRLSFGCLGGEGRVPRSRVQRLQGDRGGALRSNRR